MYERKVFQRYLTTEEEKRLFKAVEALADPLARRDAAWMRLLRYTGMRIGSLAGLTVADAKCGLREKHLPLADAHAKRGNGYSVYLAKPALQALRKLLKVRRAQGFAEIPDEPLIMSRNRRPLCVRSYQLRMQKWRQAAGLEVHASPHWMRHTLAKRIMAQSTASDKVGVVQHALGQRARASAEVYTFPDREEIEEAMEAAGR